MKSTDNIYRPGSNLYYILEELKRGGTRDAIAERVEPQLTLYPRLGDNMDNKMKIIDLRIMSILRTLKQKGWDVDKQGRGRTSYVKVSPV